MQTANNTPANNTPANTTFQRKDLMMLSLDQATIKEGFNIRQDYGDIEALAESILANGVKAPLRGYKENGIYTITDGHRRYTALKSLQAKGLGMDIKLPMYPEEKGYTQEKRDFDLILMNDGKKLTFIEEANLYQRIKNTYGYTNVEIAKKAGKSSMHVGNCLLLLDAPKELQQHVLDGVVSASLVIDQLKLEGGEVVLDNINQILQAQEQTNTSEGTTKKTKVSKKHLTGVKVEGVSKTKATLEAATEVTVEVELLETLMQELSEFDDMVSQAAAKTLENVLKLGRGQLDKNAFINAMLNNLID